MCSSTSTRVVNVTDAREPGIDGRTEASHFCFFDSSLALDHLTFSIWPFFVCHLSLLKLRKIKVLVCLRSSLTLDIFRAIFVEIQDNQYSSMPSWNGTCFVPTDALLLNNCVAATQAMDTPPCFALGTGNSSISQTAKEVNRSW